MLPEPIALCGIRRIVSPPLFQDAEGFARKIWANFFMDATSITINLPLST
jgi:hypothetical protein